MAITDTTYNSLKDVAVALRAENNKNIIIFAHNGTGKTRLSRAFKDIGKIELGVPDTLYYNAFTEDLFFWDNDLDNDKVRELHINIKSNFFKGLISEEMSTRIRRILSIYVDFDFDIMIGVKRKDNEGKEYVANYVSFKRIEYNKEKGYSEWNENIKISRGEENIFKWCFFLAVAQLAMSKSESYNWVKYVFIDDPISSLDDDHAIAIANHLATIIKNPDNDTSTIITTHHGLFYNVIYNELKKAKKLYLYQEKEKQHDVTKVEEIHWKLKDLSDTPFYYHVSIVKELNTAVEDNKLYTYHFSMLRDLLEKTAAFHGFEKFGDCLKKFENDPDEVLFSRMINIMSHGNYSVFEPTEMGDENKKYFKVMYRDFKAKFPFNENL